ncbi:MAG: hypothetical protein KAX93_02835 [Flavobacterium sp.]|nr:hypothetical protein [Flavobacterium sp.]MBP8157292.1 hypothetical protein [Flavobacterium sp.]
MKKAIQFLFISLFVLSFVSCSSDSDTDNPVLLKKLTGITMGQNASHTFSYNGTKLTKVAFEIEAQTDGVGYDKYVYNGDLITEIKRYNASNQNTATTRFTYNVNNQLTEVVKVQPASNYGFKNVFTYNNDGSVLVTGYSGDVNSQTNLSDITEKFYFQNGEVSQKEYSSTTLVSSTTYAYDSAHHPMHNVTGLNAIKLYNFITNGLFGMQHNMTQQTTTISGNIDTQVSMQADYNNDNYPASLYSADGMYQYQFSYFK